jgi:PEGA domain
MTRGPTLPCRGLTAAVLMYVAGLIAAGPARAAQPIEVENLIRQGVELRQKGRDHAALPFFQKAYDLERSPRTAAQLGLAELALGYSLAAEQHLSEALASSTNIWVDKNRPQLEAALKEARRALARVEVTGAPVGAEVLVNGKNVGRLPLPDAVPVTEGIVHVTLRAAGFEEQSTQVKVAAGGRERVSLRLAPAAGQSAGAARAMRSKRSANGAPPQQGGPTGAGNAGTSAVLESEPASGSVPAWVRPAAWVTGALAVTAFGVAGFSYLRMKENADPFNQTKMTGTNEPLCRESLTNYGSDRRCKQWHDASASAEKVMYASLQAGGLLAVVSIVGFIWSAQNDDNEGTTAGMSGATIAFSGGTDLNASWTFRF